jgi:hypothetical protein
MKRDSNKAVTRNVKFALLVQAVPPEIPMGKATFGVEIGQPLLVRPVTLKELIGFARKMNAANGREFSALLALRGALEARDELALAKAKERLEQVYRLREKEDYSQPRLQNEESRKKFSALIAAHVGLSPEEALKHYEGLRPGPKAMKNPSWLLSQEVSRIVAMWAQIVLWWVDGRFIPAIYCFNMKTALYIHTFFLAPSGGLGFRICPYCGEQFFQNRPNQDYCLPAHRENHRVARWRNEQNLKLTESKRKTDGTQKTR